MATFRRETVRRLEREEGSYYALLESGYRYAAFKFYLALGAMAVSRLFFFCSLIARHAHAARISGENSPRRWSVPGAPARHHTPHWHTPQLRHATTQGGEHLARNLLNSDEEPIARRASRALPYNVTGHIDQLRAVHGAVVYVNAVAGLCAAAGCRLPSSSVQLL